MYRILELLLVISIVLGKVSFLSGQRSANQTMVRYDQCGGYLKENQAFVATPNYPKNEKELKVNTYSENMDCVWERTTPHNNTLFKVKFLDMVLENRRIAVNSTKTICIDYINITIASIGTLQFCGWKASERIIAGKGPNLTITFHSNEARNYRGAFLAYLCSPNFNPCEPNPCFYGHCSPRANEIDYVCTCFMGFTGYRCEVDINECESEPCLNGGTCLQPKPGLFTCNCTKEFEGYMCEKKIEEILDPCQSNPCGSHAIRCEAYNNTFKCICRSGFTGELCNETISKCDSKPCMNEGTCSDDGDTFVCFCTAKWTGALCEINFNACLSNPCNEYKMCELENEKEYKCVCPPGFTGEHCKEDIDECSSDPCENGGSCSDENEINFYKCSCTEDFTGENCEIFVPFCTNPGIPFVEKDRRWKPGEMLQFYCADGLRLQGSSNLCCQNDTNWSASMPACVDAQNNTVQYLPTQLSPLLIFLISLASTLAVVLVIFSAWMLIKGPWNLGGEVTKVMKISRISLTSY